MMEVVQQTASKSVKTVVSSVSAMINWNAVLLQL